MAYSTVHNSEVSPWTEWVINRSTPVMFYKSINMDEDVYAYISLFPDLDGQSGWLSYDYGEDGMIYFHAYCRLLINPEKKEIFVSDTIVYYGNNHNRNYFTGSFRAFKTLNEQYTFVDIVMQSFFDPGWKFKLGFTTRHESNIKNRLAANVDVLCDSLPTDLQQLIIEKAMFWHGKKKNIDSNDIDKIDNDHDVNCGSGRLNTGKTYKWNEVVVICNPIRS